MKILHTADWHLGHRLHEYAQVEEQRLFLNWLEDYIIEEKIDMLLVSGDIFDTGVPSSQSLEMYYSFLVKLKRTSCQSIIITGGNHDSPGTLNAPKEVLNALSIKVVGKATEQIADCIFELESQGEKALVAAIPYLRDGDIRRAVASENYDDLSHKYKKALINHYQAAAEYCQQINPQKHPVIAMGHLFATGGSVSDSEQTIYVGNLGHIGSEDFPAYFDYVALGHLHRPQIIGGNPKICYAGSPHILSFSELGYDKKVMVLTLEKDTISQIEAVTVPCFRPIYEVEGSVAACIAQFPHFVSNGYGLTPWVGLVLTEKHNLAADELEKAASAYPFEIIRTTLKTTRREKGIDLDHSPSVKELLPTEVFKLKCKEMGFDLDQNPTVADAFYEILQGVKNQ